MFFFPEQFLLITVAHVLSSATAAQLLSTGKPIIGWN